MEKLSKILLITLIIVLALFAYVIFSGSILFSPSGLAFEGSESDFYVNAVTGDENISTYKNSCSEINLTNLSKDYKSLNDQMVKITGQISEKDEFIQFDKTRTHILLKVKGLEPEPYIVISYTGTIPYNNNDTIRVYGKYMFPVGIDSPPELSNKYLAEIKAGYIEKI
ncbi:MAG: hypothetical protein HVN35_06590 [Methanobacteriaceae archaeon]|nr:hypothetical protein [Methanobacteriaceae archaeon]